MLCDTSPTGPFSGALLFSAPCDSASSIVDIFSGGHLFGLGKGVISSPFIVVNALVEWILWIDPDRSHPRHQGRQSQRRRSVRNAQSKDFPSSYGVKYSLKQPEFQVVTIVPMCECLWPKTRICVDGSRASVFSFSSFSFSTDLPSSSRKSTTDTTRSSIVSLRTTASSKRSAWSRVPGMRSRKSLFSNTYSSRTASTGPRWRTGSS